VKQEKDNLLLVELIGAYDAEKLLDGIVQTLRSETESTYAQVDRAIQEAYEAGFVSILEENQMTGGVTASPDEAVVAVLRENAVTLVSKWEYSGLQLAHEATLAAVRQDWEEEELRNEFAKIIDNFQTQIDNIVRTEVNRAGNQGRLDAARYIATRYVQVYTQEDEQVCEQAVNIRGIGSVMGCKSFWDGANQNTVFRISDSVGLLPLHPRCRCYWSPVEIPVR
jgi:hypothetical protein